MKHLKKILCLALVVASIMAVALPAMAASGVSTLSGNYNTNCGSTRSNNNHNYKVDFYLQCSKSANIKVELRYEANGTDHIAASGTYPTNTGGLSITGSCPNSGWTTENYYIRVYPAGNPMDVHWTTYSW